MGQAIAHKFERRQVRRAIGNDVPKMLGEALGSQDHRLGVLGQNIAQHQGAVADRFIAVEGRLTALDRWRSRGFWGRMRWLLRGR